MTARRHSLVAAMTLPFALVSGCRSQPGTASWYQNPGHLQALMSRPTETYHLVDVRTDVEYAGGHIPTAVNIPFDRIAEFPPADDPSSFIILYCASGKRSAAAFQTLLGLGYRRVVDFGPLSRWKGKLVTSYLSAKCPCEEL